MWAHVLFTCKRPSSPPIHADHVQTCSMPHALRPQTSSCLPTALPTDVFLLMLITPVIPHPKTRDRCLPPLSHASRREADLGRLRATSSFPYSYSSYCLHFSLTGSKGHADAETHPATTYCHLTCISNCMHVNSDFLSLSFCSVCKHMQDHNHPTVLCSYYPLFPPVRSPLRYVPLLMLTTGLTWDDPHRFLLTRRSVLHLRCILSFLPFLHCSPHCLFPM